MREGPGLKRLRALAPPHAWRDVLGSGEPAQVKLWLELFRRSFDAARYERARDHAEQAAARMGTSTVSDWLTTAGVEVVTSTSASTFGTAVVRAWLDTRPLRVTLFESPLDRLTELLDRAAAPQDRGVLRDAVLAHEIFHVMYPECPGDLAEMGAHLFATRVTPLGYFAGLLDVLQALSRWWG